MSKEKKFSNIKVDFNNKGYTYGTDNDDDENINEYKQSEHKQSDNRYNDSISLQAVGKLFEDTEKDSGDFDEYENYDDTEYADAEYDDTDYDDAEYDLETDEAEYNHEEPETGGADRSKERAYIKDKEYMAYIESMARSTRTDTQKTLISPQKVQEATMRHKPVKNYDFDRRIENNEGSYVDEDEYNEDYDYGKNKSKNSNIKIFFATGGIIMLAVLSFFAVKTNSLNTKLQTIQAENEKLVKDYNTLGIDKSDLESELVELRNKYESLTGTGEDELAEGEGNGGDGENAPVGEDNQGETDGNNTTPDNSGEGDAANGEAAPNSKYTVKQGDTLYEIAIKAYGDGNKYKDIMSANNLTTETISLGQELILP